MALDYKSSLSRYRTYLQLVKERPIWSTSLWVILSLVLLILLMVLALKPTLVTISGLVGEINQQKEISVQLDEKITQVQRAITELNSVNDKLYLIDNALPTVPNWDTLASKIEAIATNSGLETTDINIEKIPLQVIKTEGGSLVGQVIPIKFTLMLTGDYNLMRKMISDLENMGRVIMINSVDISVNKEGKQVMTLMGAAGYLPNILN